MPSLARGPKIRVDVELAAKTDQALFGPHGRAVELGEPGRAEEHGVRGPAGGQRLGGQRVAVLVDGVAPERMLFDRDVDRQRVEDTDGRVADLAGRCRRREGRRS